jgi:hypothetical protein
VPGNPDTPFSTNTGSNDRRGARYQYIFPAAELLAAGACPGLITKVTFYAIDPEAACDQFVNCPELMVDLRMGNVTFSNFGPYVASQSTPLEVNWDPPTEVSAQINANWSQAFVVDSGAIHFPLTGAGFNWTGGNVVLDVSWLRAAPVGSSPPVRLVENLPYTATKWVQVTSGFNVMHGNTYQDNPLTANATTGNTFSRPVTTFNSTEEESPMAVTGIPEAGAFHASFDPLTGDAVITRRGGEKETWTVICTDITGRTIAQRAFPSGTGTLRIPAGADYAGVIVLFALHPDGSRSDLGRITTIR